MIKNLIAERFMKVLDEKVEAEVIPTTPVVEVSTTIVPEVVSASANITNDEDDNLDLKSVMSSWLKK
jgi:hypothetical protein